MTGALLAIEAQISLHCLTISPHRTRGDARRLRVLSKPMHMAEDR
jgi:hypothetical protein